jgi:hypothetical protein
VQLLWPFRRRTRIYRGFNVRNSTGDDITKRDLWVNRASMVPPPLSFKRRKALAGSQIRERRRRIFGQNRLISSHFVSFFGWDVECE